ncbi:ABC transporter ATP-binding protein [Inquilinus limosus]|uniref:ABC transporter ATP-binding protein n=1 Tax=Inquilinus limosus TaxID=171674 RepID=UPI000407B731|nr:ABC transporter ATP-binding protein [Inquilinus limosus]
MTAPLLEIAGLHKRFRLERTVGDALRRRPAPSVHALNGVDLSVRRGETLGIVGESGSGKSTLAHCIVRLIEPDEGTMRYDGVDIRSLAGAERRAFNRRVQMVFQDPRGSLNPRMTVRQTLAEALAVHRMRPKAEIPARIAELLDLVRLPREAADRHPHEFSGGQRQRIGIARALSVEPECLIADELVSALDVSVQAQMVNLLLELQQRLGLTVLFVAHDLRLVRHLSHRVAVMYLGSIVETGETEALFAAPQHPYTRALLAAAPDLDPAKRHRVPAARGELPSPVDLPSGCPFHPRCPHAFDRCRSEPPKPRPTATGAAACHLLDAAPMPAIAARPQEETVHGW